MKQQPMARKLLALCLSLLLVLALSPTAWADPAEGGETSVPTEMAQTETDPQPKAEPQTENPVEEDEGWLREQIAKAESSTEPVTITIPAEGIKLTSPLNISKGDITLTGGVLTGDDEKLASGSRTMISVSGGTLTLKCAVTAGTGYNGARVTDGTLVLEDGAKITGGDLTGVSGNAANGGGVQVRGDSAKLIMNGGEISDNKATNGGGVQVAKGGTFEMNGGTIANNTANIRGGGLAQEDDADSVTLKGGTITGNNSTLGGDVRTNNDSFVIDGEVEAGEVQVGDQGSVTINEGAELDGNVTVSDNWPAAGNEGPAIENNGTLDGNLTTGGDNVVVDNGENGQITGGISEGIKPANPNKTYTIQASAGANGSISPAGAVPVAFNKSQTFTIAPASGYHVQDVKVDGGSVGAVTSYTFNSVNSDHTIEATFARNPFTEPEYYPDYDEDVDYLPPVDEEEPEETEDLYMVTCRTLNVRLGGGTGYARIGTLSRGTVVSGELENGWLKFAYNDQTAYCSADYLAKVDGDLTDMHVTCRTLNVRAGAGTNFEILGTLSRGTEVEILDVLNGWYKIEYLGGEAYVSAAYIG